MMQPQGNVGPAGQPPAPGGGGQEQEAIQRFQQALQQGDPQAIQALKQAKAQQGGQMAPQGQMTPAPGAQMAPQGAPPGPGGPGANIPPAAQQVMQALKGKDPQAMQALKQAMAAKNQQGGGAQPPPGAEGLGAPGMQQEMLDFVKKQMEAKKKTSLEEQAMKKYLMQALEEAQGQPGPGGSATAPMPGAGQATVDQVGNRGNDIDAAVRAAGG
jgi:hypothetical protein